MDYDRDTIEAVAGKAASQASAFMGEAERVARVRPLTAELTWARGEALAGFSTELQRIADHMTGGAPSTAAPKRCLVHGCPNDSDAGGFVGDLCAPCHDMITTGVVGHGETFVHKMRDALKELHYLVTDAQSGYISLSGPDEEWCARRDRSVREADKFLSSQTTDDAGAP